MKTRSLLPLLASFPFILSVFCASTVLAQLLPPITNPPLEPQIVSITPTDSEAAEPQLLPPGVLAAIHPNTATFLIIRKGTTDFDLPVFYHVEGSAVNGLDYVKLPGSIVIPKGESSVTLEIVPLADALTEGTETVAVVLDPPVCIEVFPQPRECYLLGPHMAAKAVILDTPVGIHNLPPLVEITHPTSGQVFEAPDFILVEAQTTDSDGYAPFVEFYSDGAKIGESRIVFIKAPEPGTVLSHSFTWKAPAFGIHELVAVAQDDRGATSKSAPVRVSVTPVGVPPEVNIVATDPEAAEPRTPLPTTKFAINKGQFVISRTGMTDSPLTVQVKYFGEALNGVDYETLPPAFEIPAGTNSITVDVLPINDQIIEPTETLSIVLVPRFSPGVTGPGFPGYTIGKNAVASLKILDNGEGPPPLPVVSVVASDPEATEPPTNDPNVKIWVNTGSFTITRTGVVAEPLSVYLVVEGTATSGLDYTPLEHSAFIPAGAQSVVIPVVPLFDGLKEGDESVVVRLVPPPFDSLKDLYHIGADGLAKVVIHDNGIVVENSPPKADIVSPSSGALFHVGDTVNIEVQTADADGYVPFVEFYADGSKIGESRLVFIKAPAPGTILTHSFAWKAPALGVHELVAVAHDDQDAASKTAPVTIKVTTAIPRPEVNLVTTDAEAAEPRTPLPWEKFAINKGQFVISRTGATESSLTVQVTYHGSALNGVDFEMLPLTFTIPPGTNSTTVDLFPINDQIIEPTEIVEILLVPLDIAVAPVAGVVPGPDFSPYSIGIHRNAFIKILDNGEGPPPVPVISVIASDPEATEPPTNDPNVKIKLDSGSFTVSRTGVSTEALTIFFFIEGTAIPGLDYVLLDKVVAIPAGAQSVTIPVIPLFDRIKEGDESVVIRLAQPPFGSPRAYYVVGADAEAKMVIHDNGIVVDNSPPKADIVSPASGDTFHLADVVKVQVQTADADGYVPWVELFAGKLKVGDSHLNFFRAPDPGTLITHTFGWLPGAVGEYVLTAIAHDDRGATTTTAAIVIKVIEHAPLAVVYIKAIDAEGAEPDPVAPGMGRPTILNPVVFEITRRGDLTLPLVVHYHLEGTAKNGSDYDLLPGRIEIPKGESSVKLVVNPIDDDLVEGDETIVAVIDPPICLAVAKPQPGCYGVLVGEGAAKGVIKDNDPNASLRPTVTIAATDPIATEGKIPWATPTATFVVYRHGPTNESLTVGLKVAGTATPGKDYEALPDSVVIPAGERRVKLVVTPVDDTEPEALETISVELLPPSPGPGKIIQLGWPAYRVGRPATAIAVILDNDQTRPPCRWLSDGHFHICLPGVEGAKYRLEISDDLQFWVDGGPVETADGAVHYVDPDAPGSKFRFYRIVPDIDPSAP